MKKIKDKDGNLWHVKKVEDGIFYTFGKFFNIAHCKVDVRYKNFSSEYVLKNCKIINQ